MAVACGVEFNYESMEDELTCPVCLELYADPLMLPCSHSVCKKCFQDIIDSHSKGKAQPEGVECPSCRQVVKLSKGSLAILPKNLALENVVIRYSEERSKSIRKSLSLESPVADLLVSPVLSECAELPEFPTASNTSCELCEMQTPSKAAWFCIQCEVAYCHSCFAKYHPRRGALARHKVRQPKENEAEEKTAFCEDHKTEQASIFCDNCKTLVCQLCVCDGVGKHAGHKILAPETACHNMKEAAETVREQGDSLLASLMEQRCKLDTLSEDIKEVHKSSSDVIELQYQRLLQDITTAIKLEKDLVLQNMEGAKSRCLKHTKTCIDENIKSCKRLEDLSEACDNLAQEEQPQKMLQRASEVEPLTKLLAKSKKDCEVMTRKYESILKDKAPQTAIQSGLEQFRSRSGRTLRVMLDGSTDKCQTMIPRIKSPTSPGKPDLTPKVQSKCLITWGFTSTSFTGEEIKNGSTWTVSIERNVGHWGQVSTGYLFGIGVASDVLNVKALVGMDSKSHGVICSGGSLFFSHNGEQEHLMSLRTLPLCVSITVQIAHPDYIIFQYKFSYTGQGTCLVGRKVITDASIKKIAYPVFTVSQRIKLVFPTT